MFRALQVPTAAPRVCPRPGSVPDWDLQSEPIKLCSSSPTQTTCDPVIIGLKNASSCLPCTTQEFCLAGRIMGIYGGFYCFEEALGNLFSSGDTYKCPPGYYCPPGTWVPLPCKGGTYADSSLTYPPSSMDTCLPCPNNFYCPYNRSPSLATKRKEISVLPAQVSPQGRKQVQVFANRDTSTPLANATSVSLGSFARTTQTRSTQFTYKQKVAMNVLLATTVLLDHQRRFHVQPELLGQVSEEKA